MRGENNTRAYVEWMIGVYTDATGYQPDGPGAVEQAMQILYRHTSRWPAEEDFVSLIAVEFADRVRLAEDSLRDGSKASFLKMLDRVADTVRHRIARVAKRTAAHAASEGLEELAAPQDGGAALARSIAQELLAGLSLEEQVALELCLSGASIAAVAEQLKVSPRTVYRRLNQIRRRLEDCDGGPSR